jgi:hypothetical protein
MKLVGRGDLLRVAFEQAEHFQFLLVEAGAKKEKKKQKGGSTQQKMATASLESYFSSRIETLEVTLREKQSDLRRLEAQRNELNHKVRSLKEEISLLQEPGNNI